MLSQAKLALGALLAVALVGCYSSRGPKGEQVSLVPEAVLPIESDIAIEPSGLCLRDGELFSVSDDTDDVIFHLSRSDSVARFEPFIKFEKPEGSGFLDLEGIATGPEGSFYLLSEAHSRILQVFPDGRSVWATESVYDAGRGAGLFRVNNGGLEGFACLGDRHFLLLAERQPRGWLEVDGETVIDAARMPTTRYGKGLALSRIPDFTGADFFDDKLYVLFRNGELVTTLERTQGGWAEGALAWSFASTIRDQRWSYRDKMYGMAEGLAVDEDYFYVVVDNNGSPRSSSADDVRPLLLILKR